MDRCEFCGEPDGPMDFFTYYDDGPPAHEFTRGCVCQRCEFCDRPCGQDTYCSRRCAEDGPYWDAVLSGPEGEEAEVTI